MLRIVFLGMEGRLTTRPLEAVARQHTLVGVVKGRRPGPDPFDGNLARFAKAYGVPLHADRSLEAFLRQQKPDLLCLSNYPFLLPASVLAVAPAVNLHPSLLPSYRGVYPLLWQFYHQEPEGGWTVHCVDEGMDTGDVLAQERYPIPFGATVTELLDQVLSRGAELMARSVDSLARGTASPTPQSRLPHPVSEARLVTPGERLVDWERWPVRRVYHFLRGASLWHDELKAPPGFVSEVTAFSEERPGLPPGTFGQGFVACLDGKLFFRYRRRA